MSLCVRSAGSPLSVFRNEPVVWGSSSRDLREIVRLADAVETDAQ